MKKFILFARLYTSLIFAFPVTVAAQVVDQYPNYVVIGAFAHHKNAVHFTDDANKNNFPARFEINPNRNLYYVYVLSTDDRQFAIAEAVKLRAETKYFDTWVYCGALGKMVLANPDGQQDQDVDPVTGKVIELVGSETEGGADARKPGVDQSAPLETEAKDVDATGANSLSSAQETTLNKDANSPVAGRNGRRRNRPEGAKPANGVHLKGGNDTQTPDSHSRLADGAVVTPDDRLREDAQQSQRREKAGDNATISGSEGTRSATTTQQQSNLKTQTLPAKNGKQPLIYGSEKNTNEKGKQPSIDGTVQSSPENVNKPSNAVATNTNDGSEGTSMSPSLSSTDGRVTRQKNDDKQGTAPEVNSTADARQLSSKNEEEVPLGPPPIRATTAPLKAEEVIDKAFYFHIFRADNARMIAGEVDAIDFERARKMATYEANKSVTVRMPSGKTKQVSFLCQVFGYRKQQQEFNPGNPAEHFYLDDKGNVVIPFELVRLQKGDIAIMYNVFFYKDAAVMRPESRYEVNNLLELLNENPSYKIVIHGHTNGNASGKIIRMDSPGNFYTLTGTKQGFGSAKKLSEERAIVIREFLISSGISADRMEVRAWGGKKPIHDKHSARAHENVRVEIEILSQ